MRLLNNHGPCNPFGRPKVKYGQGLDNDSALAVDFSSVKRGTNGIGINYLLADLYFQL
jgi:hypothetical protein